MKKVLSPFRVGLFVILVTAIFAGFFVFVRKGDLGEKDVVRVFALFKDASGLTKKSRVQIAGIPVGEIEDIQLEGTRAKVFLRIKKAVNLRQDAALAKRSESLLGDYLLDLRPGTDAAPAMENGGQIVNVLDAQGMDQVFTSLSSITADIQAVTTSLRNVLGGDKGQNSLERIVENLVRLSDTVDGTVRENASRLDTILQNVEGISSDVRKLTASEGDNVSAIVANLEGATRDARDVMSSVKQIVGSNESDLKGSVASLKQTLERLDRSLANIEEVTQKVREGKGAAGALLADERLGQKVGETIEDVADFAGRITGLQTEVGIRTDWLVTQSQAKIFLDIRLMPKPDKFYLLQLIDDPRGSVDTVYIQKNPPDLGDPALQRQTTTRESLKFSAQFAKRYSFITLRFGIIESTGGLGVDFSVPIKLFYQSKWLEDALVLKLDAFNFSVDQLVYPRLRATLRFTPLEHVFVNVGFDDIINRPNRDTLSNRLVSGRDFFFGAGIYFTDQDLKSILTVAPIRP